MFGNIKQKQLIIVIGVFIGLIALVSVVWLLLPRVLQVEQGIEIRSVPGTVTVAIDEQRPQRTGWEQRIPLEPGEYDLRIEADGFESEERSVTVTSGEIEYVWVDLQPLTDEAQETYDSAENRQRREAYEGYVIDQGAQEYERLYPWMNALPLADVYWQAYPCQPHDQEGHAICIELLLDNETQRANALEALAEADIDVDEVDIVWTRPARE